MKSYLVYLEFICGEFGQMFERVFDAENLPDLEQKIDDYLSSYYGGKHEKEDNAYLYHHGEVAVKLHGWEEIGDPLYVIERLRM